MKKIFLLFLFISLSTSVFGVGLDGQFSSCSGSQTVTVNGLGTIETVNLGSGISTQYPANGGSAYQCGTCFYGGHIYTGYNRGNWSDTFINTSNTDTLDLINEYSWWATKRINNNFVWGDSVTSASSPLGWTSIVNPASAYNGLTYYRFAPNVSLLYSNASGIISQNSVGSGATQSMRSQPGYLMSFNSGYVKVFNATTGVRGKNTANDGDHFNHVQCTVIFPRWCGDNIRDTDKNEQCDDGNMTSGDGCSNICQTEVTPPPAVCTGETLVPTTLTSIGGSITATCNGTNTTQYRFVLRKNNVDIQTVPYQSSNATTFSINPNNTTTAENYSVQCYAKNAVSTDITNANLCVKSFTVPGITVVTPLCTGLTVTPQTFTDGGTVNYTCTGDNVTSYSVVFSYPNGNNLQTLTSATGTVSIPPTPTGIYTARCFVNGQTNTPAICEKTITNNGTTVNPAIQIDKRDANNADLDGNIGNDTQTVNVGNPAVFKIRVTNTGTEDLRNIELSDTVSPNCAGSVTLPSSFPGSWGSSPVVGGSGNHTDSLLQPGEYFEYICDKGNTVNNYTNSATVNAVGNISNTPVTSTDTTVVIIQNIVTPALCTNLTLSTSGNTVNYSCTGTGPITSYSILQNGSQISTSASGSVTVGNGTHNFVCYVNGSITSSSCQKSVTLTPPSSEPQIEVTKDDNDNHDDSQYIQNGEVHFSIKVRNRGSESLTNVTLSDPYAPECNRSDAETRAMIQQIGNRDNIFNPGESFTYVCHKYSVQPNTFPGNRNSICTNGRGTPSNISVSDCDDTFVYIETEQQQCERIELQNEGDRVIAQCFPSDEYTLIVSQGRDTIETLRNPNGIFETTLGNGTYSYSCLRRGERNVQSACQKNLTRRPESSQCILTSRLSFGGAPLNTTLTCETPRDAQCRMEIYKDGILWREISRCETDVEFLEKGSYSATCIVGDADIESCHTEIRVDVMTETPTGPFTLIIIIVSLAGGYILYRRRTA